MPEAVPKRPAHRPPGTSKLELDPEIETRLLKYVRAGGFAWVCAESAGISRATFHRRMQQGAQDEDAGRETAFCAFREKVRQAHAEARLSAEIEVRRDEPLAWLTKGPGRTQPDAPGWTDAGEADRSGLHVTIVFAEPDGKVS